MASLFDPIQLGSIHAANRIIMAPMTRGRATKDHIPTEIMIDYYRERASAGLIIAEGTGISQEGLGWPYAPGIWSKEQVEAWKPIVDAVHEAGGKIISQLWHMGRTVHPSFHPHPISASDTTAPRWAHTYDGKKPYEQARALPINEIPRLLNDYAQAAKNAMEAGFDGVQIHAANGYLIDQFLRDSSNFREDEYGGSIENRIRLLIQVTQTVNQTVGADKTSVRLSPNELVQGVIDSNSEALFVAATQALSKEKINFLEVREPRAGEDNFIMADLTDDDLYPAIAPAMRKNFDGHFIINGSYNGESAKQAMKNNEADGVAFGRPFISNPDLVNKIKNNIPFTPDDAKTWFTQGKEGYSDY
ncbi:2 [Commensalibacter communis]|uniref:Old Yellow Enzyme (OYE) family (FadH) n=1 Tax=Commensalibacter communis TaxID=2972786 RepID=A0A9W4TPE1_9PROT|nr:alkene reductase [Commensalibacter communis]CAI3922813.1 2 [Commensalibacter communis] [Commensalibacter communis]CAI3923256.1 2 [Commensalibacter communis] [Commensalibacter communis]CAI3935444.1 2 [Commensalibacter communis] [Commensalibacter communis]CAI3945091.1 2 [Commensalibacter communis] [Commensalibacter communis]CAI3947399.1 2 [Commensalibacter communis] [Commensalibacter communis]